jgi:hypothetical protein
MAKSSSEKELKTEMVKQMLTLATNGFGLVAALAWNNVIQEFVATYVKRYLAVGSGVISLLIYAVLVTILAVSVTYQLAKLVQQIEKSSPKTS